MNFVKHDAGRHGRIQRFETRCLRDRHQLVAACEKFFADSRAFVADDDGQRLRAVKLVDPLFRMWRRRDCSNSRCFQSISNFNQAFSSSNLQAVDRAG